VYGSSVFSPIHVEDVEKVVEQALNWPPGLYDVAGRDAVTLEELVKTVARIFHNKRVFVLHMPRFIARIQLTESNLLGAEQTVHFNKTYGRPLEQGLKDVCDQMSQ
jgi:uncharacterized protein YbjT (DUF2867 family)